MLYCILDQPIIQNSYSKNAMVMPSSNNHLKHLKYLYTNIFSH